MSLVRDGSGRTFRDGGPAFGGGGGHACTPYRRQPRMYSLSAATMHALPIIGRWSFVGPWPCAARSSFIMARLPRLYAPRIPQLVQARLARPLAPAGEPAPAASLDRIRGWLAEAVQDTAPLAIHAWAILPDAITLLATPGNERILSNVMQSLGRRLGSGMLRARVYSGRYHNALLEPGRWVLPAMLWVETLPVANGHVGQATQWPWSSAAEHAGLADGSPQRPAPGSLVLSDHADYWNIGDTPFARQATWRQRLAGSIGQAQRTQIEAALHGQWALGEKIFLAHLGRLASRRVTPAPRGRPRKDDQPGGESRTRRTPDQSGEGSRTRRAPDQPGEGSRTRRTPEYGTSRRRPER